MNNIIALIGFILGLVPVFACICYLYYQELKKIKKVSERILVTIIIISFVTGVTILYALGI